MKPAFIDLPKSNKRCKWYRKIYCSDYAYIKKHNLVVDNTPFPPCTYKWWKLVNRAWAKEYNLMRKWT